MQDRRFAFVLGAGASKSSGIPTGAELVDLWLTELRERDPYSTSESMEDWTATADCLQILGFTYDRRAMYYPQIYEKRFMHDPESGYAYLEKIMENAEPSVGYSVLAQLLSSERHKVVVTTNFDNLIADSLSIYTDTFPLVCGHESLADFVVPSPRRPVIAKVHRDLLFAPKNKPSEVDRLDEGWRNALTSLFRHYSPIVIGYGGNDGSLFRFLEELDYDQVPGPLVWCHYGKNNIDEKVSALLDKAKGILVRIDGFDELMLVLSQELNYESLALRLEDKTRKRIDSFNEQLQKLKRKLEQAPKGKTLESHYLTRNALHGIIERDLESRKRIIDENPTNLPALVDLAKRHIETASWAEAEKLLKRVLSINDQLQHIPGKANTYTNLGRVYHGMDNLDKAEKYYADALILNEELASLKGQAIVLGLMGKLYIDKGNLEKATDVFKKAIQLDEEIGWKEGVLFNAGTLGLLARKSRQLDVARIMLTKASDAAHLLGQDDAYAVYLGNLGSVYRDLGELIKAKEIYEKALRLAEDRGYAVGIAITHDNLGVVEALLENFPKAESHFRKSLWIDEEIGSKDGAGKHKANLGIVYWLQGKKTKAQVEWESAEILFREAKAGNLLKRLQLTRDELGKSNSKPVINSISYF